jgi:hypothetical protein
MKIDIDALSEAELVDLNNRIVAGQAKARDAQPCLASGRPTVALLASLVASLLGGVTRSGSRLALAQCSAADRPLQPAVRQLAHRSGYRTPFAHAQAATRHPSAVFRNATVNTAPDCATFVPFKSKVIVAGRTT